MKRQIEAKLRFVLHSIFQTLKINLEQKCYQFIHDLPILDRPKEQFEILKGIHDIDISEKL